MPVAEVGKGVGYFARADAVAVVAAEAVVVMAGAIMPPIAEVAIVAVPPPAMADAARRAGDRARRFVGRGRSIAGGEESGSNGGSRDAADRFWPAMGGGEEGIRCLRGESMIASDCRPTAANCATPMAPRKKRNTPKKRNDRRKHVSRCRRGEKWDRLPPASRGGGHTWSVSWAALGLQLCRGECAERLALAPVLCRMLS
jgi:hypothetical protein